MSSLTRIRLYQTKQTSFNLCQQFDCPDTMGKHQDKRKRPDTTENEDELHDENNSVDKLHNTSHGDCCNKKNF